MIPFTVAVVLGISLWVRGAGVIRKDHYAGGKAVLGMACEEAGKASLAAMMPLASFQGEKTESSWAGMLFSAIKDQIPVLQEKEKSQTAEEQKEAGDKENTEEAEDSGNTQESLQSLAEASREENEKKACEEENRKITENGNKEEAQEVETSATAKLSVPEALEKKESIPIEQLADDAYVLKRFFVVDPDTSTLPSEIHAETFLEKDLTMEQNSGEPQILIYHTHSQETFADSVPGDQADTVVGVGDYLQQILKEQYGYQVLHVTEAFDMEEGKLERSRAYQYAEPVISKTLEEHPSLQVVIDLHRDGVEESKHLVTEINGKPTAKIMFFNGLCRTNQNGSLSALPNPYIQDNLAFSFQLEYLSKEYYPDFTRCIYLKGYRYNLHLRPRSLLLEVGAQNNTVAEAKNAMEPFADLLHKVLSGQG